MVKERLSAARTAELLQIAANKTLPEAERAAAIRTLDEAHKKEAAVPLLSLFLDAEEPEALRITAALCIGTIENNRRTLQPIIDAALYHKDASVRFWAVWTLDSFSHPRAILPLVVVLENSREQTDIRGEAAHSLGMRQGVGVGRRRAVAALIRALYDPEPEIRFWAAYGLSQQRRKCAITPLLQLARDPASVYVLPGLWSLRREALWAVACLRAKRSDDVGMPGDEQYNR